jgi:hypothetical protein
MSDELVKQMQANIDGLNAQLEAHKQTLSESITLSLNLRATVLLFQKQLQESSIKLVESEKKVLELSKPVDANKAPGLVDNIKENKSAAK